MDTRKMLMTSLALGAAYLMKNKDARQKVMSQLQNVTNRFQQPSKTSATSSTSMSSTTPTPPTI